MVQHPFFFVEKMGSTHLSGFWIGMWSEHTLSKGKTHSRTAAKQGVFTGIATATHGCCHCTPPLPRSISNVHSIEQFRADPAPLGTSITVPIRFLYFATFFMSRNGP